MQALSRKQSANAIFPAAALAVPLIPLPIGISFYTFQTMSYTIDVYRNDSPVQRNFISFGTYVALFPQLIAGPIVRYVDVADQLDNRRENWAQFNRGVKIFLVGLAKKVLIANQMGSLWSTLKATGAENVTHRLLGRHFCVCTANLFRFQRIFRHGARAWKYVRV